MIEEWAAGRFTPVSDGNRAVPGSMKKVTMKYGTVTFYAVWSE